MEDDEDDKITTIQLKTSTRELLRNASKGKETYDEQLRRLLVLEASQKDLLMGTS